MAANGINNQPLEVAASRRTEYGILRAALLFIMQQTGLFWLMESLDDQ
jgi:hypothetical protein